jgi:hypothetical protein
MKAPILCALVASTIGACVYDWSLPAGDGAGGAARSTPTPEGGQGGEAPLGGAAGEGGTGGTAGSAGQGGAPGVCTPDGADDACTGCLKVACCDRLESCEGDASCQCWIACLGDGGDCFAQCPNPSVPAQQLGVCAGASCTADCL